MSTYSVNQFKMKTLPSLSFHGRRGSRICGKPMYLLVHINMNSFNKIKKHFGSNFQQLWIGVENIFWKYRYIRKITFNCGKIQSLLSAKPVNFSLYCCYEFPKKS